jgi:hypothetical protein
MSEKEAPKKSTCRVGPYGIDKTVVRDYSESLKVGIYMHFFNGWPAKKMIPT